MPKNTARVLFSGLFFLIGIGLTALTLWLSLTNLNRDPAILKQPSAALEQVDGLMEALCAGDFETAREYLYGTPELQAQPEDEAAQLLWEAYIGSLQYTRSADCYASADGLAVDVSLSMLDLDSVTIGLHNLCQTMLDREAENAEDPDLIYSEDGQYRQELVMDVFHQALTESLRENASYIQKSLTLHLTYENQRWWVTPEETLLSCLGGNL